MICFPYLEAMTRGENRRETQKTKLTSDGNIPTVLVEVEGDGWSWGR
jgi:hypothetical protein